MSTEGKIVGKFFALASSNHDPRFVRKVWVEGGGELHLPMANDQVALFVKTT